RRHGPWAAGPDARPRGGRRQGLGKEVRAQHLGATHVVNVTTDSLVEVVKGLTDGRGADASFEVTGVQAPLLVLGDVTRMSGKMVIVGYHQGGHREIPLAQWNYKAFQILNAHFREEATIMRGM